MRQSPAFKPAFGGICLALTLVFLFGGTIVPGVDMTFFAITSLFTAVMIIETGVGGGLLLFAGASILGLFLLPGKVFMLPYIALFGYYPVVKCFIEKIKAPLLQVLCKCAFFACVLCVGLTAFAKVVAQSIHLPDYPVFVLIPAGILFLLLYDFVLTFLIRFYYRRFRGLGNDKLKLS